MKKITRIITAMSFAVLLAGRQAHATAVIGATEPTQIMNNIELVMSEIAQVEQLAQQVQMVATQLNQYDTMRRNLASLSPYQWAHVGQLITNLKNLERSATGFAYAANSWDALYNAQHPDFSNYLASPSLSRPAFTTLYSKWNTDNATAIKQAVSAAGLVKANFDTDETTLTTLDAMSENGDGQKQVLQAGNKFAKMLNEQILILRELISSEIKMQAYKNEQEAAQTAETMKATKSTTNFVTGVEKHY
jgi:P-type conjugative transfer protein TrbJ